MTTFTQTQPNAKFPAVNAVVRYTKDGVEGKYEFVTVPDDLVRIHDELKDILTEGTAITSCVTYTNEVLPNDGRNIVKQYHALAYDEVPVKFNALDVIKFALPRDTIEFNEATDVQTREEVITLLFSGNGNMDIWVNSHGSDVVYELIANTSTVEYTDFDVTGDVKHFTINFIKTFEPVILEEEVKAYPLYLCKFELQDGRYHTVSEFEFEDNYEVSGYKEVIYLLNCCFDFINQN